MLLHDTGEPMDTIRCVACKICERECPPQCIYIEKSTEKIENADGKPQFYPAKFDIDVSVCMSFADGTTKPYRYRVRPPSLINLTVLRDMCLGGKIADAVIILGSIDIVLGEVDR